MDNKQVEVTKRQEGVTVSLVFMGLAAFLYLKPDYLCNHLVSGVVGSILAIIGVSGLGVELNKLSRSGTPLGLDNLGIGVGFGALWALAHFSWPIPWVNVVILPLLALAMYGVTLGAMNMIYAFTTSELSFKRVLLIRLPITVAQIAGAVLAVLQVLLAIRAMQR